VSSWLAFSCWTVSSCLTTARAWLDGAADTIQDRIFDLGCSQQSGAVPVDEPESGTLPPLDVARFVLSVRDKVDLTLERSVDAINEEPGGDCGLATEERVLALFHELGQEVLSVALEMRVAAAEKQLDGPPGRLDEWAKKYRRMLAAEGRWPAA
jgi:hypothetical protein